MLQSRKDIHHYCLLAQTWFLQIPPTHRVYLLMHEPLPALYQPTSRPLTVCICWCINLCQLCISLPPAHSPCVSAGAWTSASSVSACPGSVVPGSPRFLPTRGRARLPQAGCGTPARSYWPVENERLLQLLRLIQCISLSLYILNYFTDYNKKCASLRLHKSQIFAQNKSHNNKNFTVHVHYQLSFRHWFLRSLHLKNWLKSGNTKRQK